MKKILKTFILAICLILPSLFILTACGGEKETAKVSSFSVELANTSYTLVEDTITVTYGGDYRLSVSDFSVTATFDDETSKTLTSSELEDFGFTFENNIPNSEKTPVGIYEISIKHEGIETSKTISLIVEKATINYSESDVIWSASEFNYDGTEKTVTITNLPETLEVTYQNNTKTSPNEYTATATISAKDSDNYNFAEITVEHTWEIKLVNHTITYDNTYGLTNNNPTTYTLLSEKITLTSLSRDYYTFDGWYYNDTKITEIPKGFTGGDITLQAKWTAITYTITYQDEKDVKNPNPTKYTIEDGEIALQPLPNRVDYTFRYWERVYDNPVQIDINPTTTISVSKHKGNLTLKAIWDRKTEYDAFTYTVSEDCTKAIITRLTNESSTSITIPKGVVAIGNNAFKNCTTLSTVNFEEGSQLLTIGDYAFYFCGIRSITIPATVTEIGSYAFSRSGISEMNFLSESNLATIGNNAFDSCEYLTEFTIPDSVNSMGRYVFNACISLTKIVFGKGMTVIGEYVYGGSSVLREIEFKGEITSFHKNALSGVATKNVTLILNWNQRLLEKEVYFAIGGGSGYSDDYRVQGGYYREKAVSDTITFCEITFGNDGFIYDATNVSAEDFRSDLQSYNKTSFTNLKFVLPKSADDYFLSIKTFVSKYDDGTVRLTIEGANSISEAAFARCHSLKEVIISEGVEKIGSSAFQSCEKIQKVTFGKSLTTLKKSAFNFCVELTDIVIPNNVTIIEYACFFQCANLESVKLSSSITEICQLAFSECDLLKIVIIPEGVTKIETQAFFQCDNLESVVIPVRLTSIGNGAFYKCLSLTTVFYMGTAEQWEEINIYNGEGFGNSSLLDATVYYYSETQPTDSGNYWHYVNGEPTAW